MSDTTKLSEPQAIGLRNLARARGPADRTAVPLSVRYALFRRGLVNGAWRITPAGETYTTRIPLESARSGGAR